MRVQELPDWRGVLRTIEQNDNINHVFVVLGQGKKKSFHARERKEWTSSVLDTLEVMAGNIDWATAFRVISNDRGATVFPVFFSNDGAIQQFGILETYLRLGGLSERPRCVIEGEATDGD